MELKIQKIYKLYSNAEMPDQKGCMVLVELIDGASGMVTLTLDEDITSYDEQNQIEAVKRYIYKSIYAGRYQTEQIEAAKAIADKSVKQVEEINQKLDKAVQEKVESFNKQLSEEMAQAIDGFKIKIDELKNNFESKIGTLTSDIEGLKKQVTSKELSQQDKKDINAQYPQWVADQLYQRGSVVKYQDQLYQVTADHNSTKDTTPDKTATYYVIYHNPSTEKVEVIDEWKQPVDAKTSYMVGNKVKHNGFTWECLADYVKVEPAVTSPVWKKIG